MDAGNIKPRLAKSRRSSVINKRTVGLQNNARSPACTRSPHKRGEITPHRRLATREDDLGRARLQGCINTPKHSRTTNKIG